MKQLILIATAFWAVSCSSNNSLPLQQFVGEDRSYFPEFIREYFEAARLYEHDYPVVEDAASQVRLIQVKRLIKDGSSGRNESNLAWSADGVYLSYEVLEQKQRAIQVKNLKGDYKKDLMVLPRGRNDFLDGLVSRQIHSYNAGLTWSKDSTRYAFMSNGGFGVYNIYVGGVGAEEHPVISSKAKDGYATWGPNGRYLAFVSSRTGAGDVYLYHLGSDRVIRLTYSKQVDLFPVWSPAGDKIAYASGDQRDHNIMLVEKRDKKWQRPRALTIWSEDDLRPTFSPDGKLLAFYSSQPSSNGKRWNIHAVRVDQENLDRESLRYQVVAKDVVVDLNTGPAWSPNSRRIFYVKREPDRFNPIYAYDLFTGRTYRLNTDTKMNRDILISNLGVLSFRAQVGAWDRVFLALTNQGSQLQKQKDNRSKIHFGRL